MKRLDAYHEAEEIQNGVYRISEGGFVNMYLVIGSEKALLIDNGCGAGDMIAAVRQLTDKPLIFAATHNHPDHIGAAGQLGTIYMDPDDLADIYFTAFGPAASRRMCDHGKMEYNPDSEKDFEILPITDETVFDLGGRKLVTEKLPGHTAGCRIFIDHENKLIVSGDAVNLYMFLQRPGGLTVEEWLRHTDSIVNYLKNGYSSWYGHGDGKQPLEQVEKIIGYGKELIRMKKAGELRNDEGMYPEDSLPRVYYRTDRILSGN